MYAIAIAIKDAALKWPVKIRLRTLFAGVGALLIPVLPILAGRGGIISTIAARLWESQVREYEKQDRTHPPHHGGVLFFGSSSIRRWDLAQSFPGQGYINRGFGGSQISDAIQQAPRIVLPYSPRLIVFYSGENDLAGGKSARQVCDDYQRFCELIHKQLPETQLLILQIKPSPVRSNVRGAVEEINEFLKSYCAQDSRRTCLDVYSPMLNSAGEPRRELFGNDALHLSTAGYELWTSLVQPEICHLLAQEPATSGENAENPQSRDRS